MNSNNKTLEFFFSTWSSEILLVIQIIAHNSEMKDYLKISTYPQTINI